jgi:hypothetical protein
MKQVLIHILRHKRAYERETGARLPYCGEFHFSLESGHAMNSDHAELARIELSDAQRADAMRRCDQVFSWFTAWTDELLRYAQTQRRRALELV